MLFIKDKRRCVIDLHSMKRIVIQTILLCSVLFAFSAETQKKCHELSQISAPPIYKMIETGESLDDALLCYQMRIRTSEIKGDKRLQADCLFQIARIYYWQTDYTKSLATTKKALEIANHLDDRNMLVIGYDLLAHLHDLFSPEQAEFYYQKCRQYCDPADVVDLTVSSLISYSLINLTREISLNVFLSLDLNSLNPLTRACLGVSISKALSANGDIEEAARYLDYSRQYLQQHSETTPLNAMYEYRMAQLELYRGDINQAWTHLEKSTAIVKKNRFLFGSAHNYDLSSKIAQAENQEVLALEYYKRSVALRDSIINSISSQNFPDELISTMKELMSADKGKNNRLLIGLWAGLTLIAGISLLYYFKSKKYRKKNNKALASIRDHATYDLHSRMKNHLMKILYRYKDGVNYCLKQIFEAENYKSADDLMLFEEDMKKANALVDTLLEWVETNPDMKPEISDFDVNETVQQLVIFYNIGFAPKTISYQLRIDEPLMVHGDKNMLIIALEHLFHRLTNNSTKNNVINVSVSKVDDKYVEISIADPENKKPALEKEIFAQRVAEFETNGKEMKTADWDFNIFAEFSSRNRAKTQIEYTSEKGTLYKYAIPL